MRLIGNVLQPLHVGATCILMSPVSFLQRPARWLKAISRSGATTSGGPNFAYELCVRKIGAAERASLDLSRWQVAFNGAEPVRAETLDRFAAAFAECGFRREAFYPCYGLAEATLFVAGGVAGTGANVSSFRATGLEHGRAEPAGPGEAGGRRLVGCGWPWAGQDLAVVDPDTGAERAAGRVGEIWLRGPSVALGYWNRDEETARTFGAHLADGAGPYLRTGDLGFVRDGELFVTGRSKDLVILRGRNHYPQDLEATAEAAHAAVRGGGVAAFSVDVAGEERLIVVAEIERRREAEASAAGEAIRRAIASEHEVAVREVVLLRAGSLPKTSSGKVQRHACKAGWIAGALEVLARLGGASESEAEVSEDSAAAGEPEDLPPPAAWWGLGSAERWRTLESWLRAEAAYALELPAARIAADRPLTALGLDSLSAIELKGRLLGTLGVDVPLGELLDGATLSDLALTVWAGLDAAPELSGRSPRRLSPPGEDAGEFPLSPGQAALWYLARLAPESRAYHVGGAARCLGDPRGLDAAALERAFAALAARHPALRTTFSEGDGGAPVQRVAPAGSVAAIEVHAEILASAAELPDRVRAELDRPFDLERGPLLRVGILRAGADTVLWLSAHYLIADFWSLSVLIRDLAALLESPDWAGTTLPDP